ncbi:MAG: fatty acid desaturase [Parvularculaceae bacterium]
MNFMPKNVESGSAEPSLQPKSAPKSAREWMMVLAQYRGPKHRRSFFELAVTLIPFLMLWTAAAWSLSVSYFLTLAICIPAAGFLIRLFTIQHDCGHGAFFRDKALNDWVGRLLGVFTLTPYYVWRRSHSIHHASSGNLQKRGIGDVYTLTVAEYNAMPMGRRFAYQVFRHPVTLFLIGPIVLFVLQHRIPLEFMKSGWKFWASAMGTNIAIGLVIAGIIWKLGLGVFLMVYVPIVLMAAMIGIWLFYVQHQYEQTLWDKDEGWDMQEAALYGSSYYALPQPLQWLTANIGIHHVHHLNSRIPFYRLPQVLRDHPSLAKINRLTLWQSFKSINLHLWDEGQRKLVSFKEARTKTA